MAVNTDAAFAISTLGESGASQPGEFGDTQKLLCVAAMESKDGLKTSESRRGSAKSLNAEQNGHRSPFRSRSAGNVSTASRSPSPLSFSRASSPEPRAPEPHSFMWLALISCFCPSVPLNIFALYFAHVSRSMIHANDFEGAKKLGRRALIFSIMAITLGLVVILYLAITET
ncbi:trafficking regulator of GLUT4 (SLC2A4) 1b [Brachyhypopomus gauderio]|uniref:trafficking regulator of GLUT4 (SLC2A4) 1b n=1 Tax=Brachyhypopomus gauderio TaxID=698409 RepID=UPI004042B62B